jgi:hypothetical protein
MSDRVFPTQPLTRLEVVGASTAVPAPARLYALESIWR